MGACDCGGDCGLSQTLTLTLSQWRLRATFYPLTFLLLPFLPIATGLLSVYQLLNLSIHQQLFTDF